MTFDVDDIKESLIDMNMYLVNLVLANPDTIMELDMDKIPVSTWLISEGRMPKGKFFVLEKDLKRAYLEFAMKFPERVWKGYLKHSDIGGIE